MQKQDIPLNQNIINFNLIITQNNVANIANQSNITNITSINNPNLEVIKKPKSKSKPKSDSDSRKKTEKKASKSKNSSNPKDKSSSNSILTFLLGSKALENKVDKDMTEDDVEMNNNAAPESNLNNNNINSTENPVKKSKKSSKAKESKESKDLEKNILETIENKPITKTFPNKFKSPIISEEGNHNIEQLEDKLNNTFSNNNFYSVVYQNKDSTTVPEEVIEKKDRPTRFPVEDKIIYDDPVFYNLTSYHLNVYYY